ncbi:MAG TPA: GAF domain-containing sensor histidine kinase [Clostridia bacterium]|nr:GAF domain-containing sensor histidine kinase [Clostridia bacterium]
MENSGYREVLQQNSKLLTTLLDVSNLVSSTMELKPLLEAILDKLRTIIEYKNAKIFITDGGRVSVIAHRSAVPKGMEDKFPLPFGSWLAVERMPLVIDDLLSDDEFAVRFRNDMGAFMDTVYKGVRCWMSLPMIYKDKVIGIMTLDHGEPGYYRTYHTELGKAFANQAAIEYENAKLFNETAKRADETKTLLSIQQAITSRLELGSVLRLIAGEARRLTNSNSTAVYLVDENAEELELAVLSGVSHNALSGMRIPVRGSPAGESLLLHESMIFDRERLVNTPEQKLAEITEMQTCLYVPLFAGSRPVGVIAAFSRVDGEFNSEDERIFSMFAPSAVIGIENARLYQEERRELQENEQRRHVAEGLREILRALNSNQPLDDILEFIVKEAARLLHTDSAALFRLTEDKSTLALEASCGLPHYAKNEIRVNSDDGILGKSFIERRPVVKNDLDEIDSLYKANPIQNTHLEWLHGNCSGIMAVPLICKDEVYGGIALYFKKDEKQPCRSITKEEIGLAMTFADQAALAIDNTRLRKQAEDMAVAAERNRLARDLHDAVTQTLFSSSLIAEVLPKIWERSREDGIKRLDELRQLTRGALAEMRTLLFELRPATLVEAPLGDLLKQLSEAVTGRARIPVSLDVKGSAKLPPEVKIVFYRITQEALNNIAKHSGASRADIGLKTNEDEQLGIITANLRIADDGKGFDPGSVTSEHFGIGIMKERAESAGAKLNVKSEPGSGTVIELEWVGVTKHD